MEKSITPAESISQSEIGYRLTVAICSRSSAHIQNSRINGRTECRSGYNHITSQLPRAHPNITTLYLCINGGISQTPSANVADFTYVTLENSCRKVPTFERIAVLLDIPHDKKGGGSWQSCNWLILLVPSPTASLLSSSRQDDMRRKWRRKRRERRKKEEKREWRRLNSKGVI